MVGEALFSAIWAVVQEIASSLAFRVSEAVRIQNSHLLQLVLQFVVFAILAVFLAVGFLVVWALSQFFT